jgi:hypothetical protein
VDLKERQIWSREQVVVLRALAEAAARPGCRFLEVGSGCGDSTAIIARVAQEHGGHVFCVDWWKGNTGTDLAAIASCEDVFAAFWDKMRRLGLQDVVVPIRGPSALAAQILKAGAFDFTFLDADHSYAGILSDIRAYAPLVREDGGILCGHDCEGRITDYDRDFLEAGKEVDFHESVHCGVVLAVGSSFADYSLHHGIWSVRATSSDATSWRPTDLVLPGIAQRRQPPPAPIAYSRSHNFVRFGRLVYAVPVGQQGVDLADEHVRQQLASAPTLQEIATRLGEPVKDGSGPTLLETYKHFNLINDGTRILALSQEAGKVRVPQLSEAELQQLCQRGDCVIGASAAEVHAVIDCIAQPTVGKVEAEPRTAACRMRLVAHHPKPRAKVSIVLLDWNVRESFHSVHYLNQQTVPRDDYELIWVEFYDRQPEALQRLLDEAKAPALDKWLVLGYPEDVYYHKHRMYNAGMVLAEGEICVFCDSDAMFEPTFVESIINAFAETPDAVIHVDEVRNYNKRFYPFNYPALREVLGKDCVNWTGTTTTGLDDSPDMLHAANYGACMAARRSDLIRIGGADEHIDYLGYICGPYEMTFRLTNFGRHERWLRHEYLYHVWHPNTSGCNVEYKGPDDGRGMSLRALQARECGRIEPWQENAAVRYLREGGRGSAALLLERLAAEDDGSWQIDNALAGAGPQLVEQNYFGFNILYYRGAWYGLSQTEGAFDPVKVQNREYRRCYSAPTRAELLRLLPTHWRWLRDRVYAVLRQVPYARRLRDKARRLARLVRARPVRPNDPAPQLIDQGYFGFNVIYYRGDWYALGQEEGVFDPAKVQKQAYRRCHTAASRTELEDRLAVGPRWLREASLGRAVLRLTHRHPDWQPGPNSHGKPHMVQEGFLGFNIVYYCGRWYGLPQGMGPFDAVHLTDPRCVQGDSPYAVRAAIRRQRTLQNRVKDVARKLMHITRRS